MVSSSTSFRYLFLEPSWVVRKSKSVKWERPLEDSHDSTERNQNIWPGYLLHPVLAKISHQTPEPPRKALLEFLELGKMNL